LTYTGYIGISSRLTPRTVQPQRKENREVSTYRKWDESKSPQWKYMLQKESAQRRKTRKELERERRLKEIEEGAPPKKKVRKKGTNIKRYVRMKDHKDYQQIHSKDGDTKSEKITKQLRLVMETENEANAIT